MIVWVAWVAVVFTTLQLFIAFINLISFARLKKSGLEERPLVSVLIPARNEEKNISSILNDLIAQKYKNIEVIVFDDNSTDSTAGIVKEIAAKDMRIQLVSSYNLPEGWLGKNWACHSLSERSKGEFMLFLDADVRVSDDLIVNTLSYLKKYDLSLVSIFPKQIIITVGEKITVPNMNYILLSLLPLILVRKSGISSFAAANGQFMFFSARDYRDLYPHKIMRSNMVEDIEIARLMKKKKYRIACLTGDDTIRCRMYETFGEAVNGFSKNVAAFFGNSIILALVFWFITTFGWIFVMIALPLPCFLVFAISILLIRVMVSIISEQTVTDNLIYIIPQQFSCGLFIYYSFINKYLRKFRWKEREID